MSRSQDDFFQALGKISTAKLEKHSKDEAVRLRERARLISEEIRRLKKYSDTPKEVITERYKQAAELNQKARKIEDMFQKEK